MILYRGVRPGRVRTVVMSVALAVGILGTAGPGAYAAANPVQRATPLALIPNANIVRMAWVGTATQRPAPAQLLTLQNALNAAPAGQTVSLDPNDYAFTTRLTVPRAVTLAAAGPSTLFAQFTVTGGGLALNPAVTVGVPATGAVITVTASNAVLGGITMINPNGVLRPIGIQLGATATGVAINDFTMDGGDQASSYGVNLTTGSATITNATISGVATGVGITAASTAAGIAVTGGSFAAVTAGITLGNAVRPSISGVTVSGSGATGTGIDLANSTGATVTSPVVSDFARGIGLSTTNAAAGPVITDAVITGTSKEGIALGSTSDATVTTPTITGTDAVQSTGINLYQATGVTLDRVVVSHYAYGVATNIGDTGAGPRITSPTMSAISTGGITLGSTQGASITHPNLTGTGAVSSTGINVVNAGRLTVSDATITGFGNGVASQVQADAASDRVDISLTNLVITGTPTASNGVSLLGAVNPTIVNVSADVTGPGVVVHDCTGVQVRNLTVTGHDGATSTSGSATFKAYDSQHVSVDHSSLDAGSYGFLLQRTDAVTITDATVANVSEYGLYGRSASNVEVSGSTFRDNRVVGNFVVLSPTATVSHDINIHDNVMTGNRNGLNLYSGTSAVQFTGNTVTGQPYAILAAPAHDVTIAGNAIALPGSAGQAALMITPLYEDAAVPGSYASSGIQIRDNTFTGEGTALQVGSPDPSTPDAARRTLLDPVLVIGNTFPAASTAVHTFANSVADQDAPAAAVSRPTVAGPVTGPVAVDARDHGDPNDWGSVCRATGYLDGILVYDGGGAAVRELTAAPVIYPTNCIELSLTESPPAGTTFRTGDLVTWTLTPHNDGLRAAPAGWSVTQLLPGGVALVAVTGAGYTVDGLTATATGPLPVGADGPVLTVQVRIVATPVTDTTMKNVAYVAPLAPADATDLDGDGFPDVIVEHLGPLVVPTLATDTATSPTDNDAQGLWTVQGSGATPAPPPPDNRGGGGAQGLGQTGARVGPLVQAALLLIGGGVLVLALARRRRA